MKLRRTKIVLFLGHPVLSLSENIAKMFRGGGYFLTHTVCAFHTATPTASVLQPSGTCMSCRRISSKVGQIHRRSQDFLSGMHVFPQKS